MILCPKCSEENPDEAVMCWACYTPLNGGDPVSSQPGVHLDLDASQLLIGGAFATLVASGWLPKRFRLGALGVAAASFSAYIALHNQEKRRAESATEERTATQRIVDHILLDAGKNQATCARLQRFARGVQFTYEVNGQWHTQMRIPSYVWQPLLTELLGRIEKPHASDAPLPREIRYRFNRDGNDDGALETLEWEPFSA